MDDLVRELKNVFILLANVSCISALEVDMRKLGLMGVLDRLLRSFVEFMVKRVRDVAAKINSEFQAHFPKNREYDVMFLAHRSMRMFNDLDSLLDKVYELKQKSLLLRFAQSSRC